MKNHRLPRAAALGFLATMVPARAPAQEVGQDVEACKQAARVFNEDKDVLIPAWTRARAQQEEAAADPDLERSATAYGKSALDAFITSADAAAASCDSNPTLNTFLLEGDDYGLKLTVTQPGGLESLPSGTPERLPGATPL